MDECKPLPVGWQGGDEKNDNGTPAAAVRRPAAPIADVPGVRLALGALARRWTVLPGSAGSGAGAGQGLTLVHFSAQPEPFLTQSTP